MNRILGWSIVLGLGCTSAGPASAWSLGDALNDAVNTVTAPVQDTVKVLQGDDPATVVQNRIDQQGQVIQHTMDAAEEVHDKVLSVSRQAIASTLGDDWAQDFDTLTSSERVQFEMQLTAGRFLGGCLHGQPCSVQQISAMPLAAALRDAYKVYWPYSGSLDPQLQQFLSPAVPWQVLQTARISIGGSPDLTVPGMLNAGYEAFNQGHAVTIGNIMIFSHNLDFNDCRDVHWLIHELRHVSQYMGYSSDVLESIDGFAVDYMTSYNSMEDDAEGAAVAGIQTLDQAYNIDCE